MDEFHTFVGYKKQSLAHLCLSSENRSNGCLCIASDHWQSFDTVFADANERWVDK